VRECVRPARQTSEPVITRLGAKCLCDADPSGTPDATLHGSY